MHSHSTICSLREEIVALSCSFSSLQCTLIHFLGGKEDLGVFWPTCGLDVGMDGSGGVVTCMSSSSLAESLTLSI